MVAGSRYERRPPTRRFRRVRRFTTRLSSARPRTCPRATRTWPSTPTSHPQRDCSRLMSDEAPRPSTWPTRLQDHRSRAGFRHRQPGPGALFAGRSRGVKNHDRLRGLRTAQHDRGRPGRQIGRSGDRRSAINCCKTMIQRRQDDQAASVRGSCGRQRRSEIRGWMIGLRAWSTHRGGLQAGSRSAVIRQVQPRCSKFRW